MGPVLLLAATGGASPGSAAGSPVNGAGAAAEVGDTTSQGAPSPPPRVRSGLVVGLSLGAGMGRGWGYPNNSNDIGKTDYASSGEMPGFGGTLMVMGALADYFDFGFWFAQESFRGGGQRASEVGGGLRVEVFPFVLSLPRIAGFGAFSEFGLGTGRLDTPGLPQAGGTQSFIGVGVLYEWSVGHLLGGHFGVGPSLEYDAVFTQPYSGGGVIASLRFVFAGGP